MFKIEEAFNSYVWNLKQAKEEESNTNGQLKYYEEIISYRDRCVEQFKLWHWNKFSMDETCAMHLETKDVSCTTTCTNQWMLDSMNWILGSRKSTCWEARVLCLANQQEHWSWRKWKIEIWKLKMEKRIKYILKMRNRTCIWIIRRRRTRSRREKKL